MNAISVRKLSFTYCTRKRRKDVLKELSFHVPEGAFVSILGSNGAGKSTLFQCILGMAGHYEGDIYVFEKENKSYSVREFAKRVAYVPQAHHPCFDYRVMDIVIMGTAARCRSFSSPNRQMYECGLNALERLGIGHLAQVSYTAISGGERQLVLLARALTQQARVLLLDEPTANLDYGNQIRVMEALQNLSREGYTIVQTTHNPEQAFLFADQILALHDGRMIASGSPKNVIKSNTLKRLYKIDVQIESILEDQVRVCVPAEIIRPAALA